MALLEQGGWTRWPPEVPSHLNLSVILWQGLYSLLICKNLLSTFINVLSGVSLALLHILGGELLIQYCFFSLSFFKRKKKTKPWTPNYLPLEPKQCSLWAGWIIQCGNFLKAPTLKGRLNNLSPSCLSSSALSARLKNSGNKEIQFSSVIQCRLDQTSWFPGILLRYL